MDIWRLENLHLADEIIRLMNTKYAHNPPSVSIKFDQQLLSLKTPQGLPVYETDLEIDNIHTITAVLMAVKEGYKPLVLNMANAHKPGGGFLNGAKAQEEDLFRCTDLSGTLKPDMYPMEAGEIIYTPKAHILRDANYDDLDTSVEVSFVSVAAYSNPPVNRWGMMPRSIYNQTKDKIRMIYKLGMHQRNDCLILGALGCGAFHNPPYKIAQMFCEVTEEYAGHFKKIVFPVMCGPNNDNCNIFQKAFIKAFTESETESETETETEDEVPEWYAYNDHSKPSKHDWYEEDDWADAFESDSEISDLALLILEQELLQELELEQELEVAETDAKPELDTGEDE